MDITELINEVIEETFNRASEEEDYSIIASIYYRGLDKIYRIINDGL